MKEIFDALNPWFFLYIFAIFAVISFTEIGSAFTVFMSGISLGLYIKNRDAWKLW